MKRNSWVVAATISGLLFMIAGSAKADRYMEKLTRGLVAVKSGSGYFLSWRLFGTDPQDSSFGFNVYKGTTKLNTALITNATSYQDNSAGTGDYSVRPVLAGVEQPASVADRVMAQNYLTIPLQNSSGYTAGDASAGDLDGDGQYEIVVKEEKAPKDNAYPGVSGSTKLAAYTLAGKFMWRIEVGVNIREGAHYTQFMVYDLDGDGIAEVAIKTAPGTKDGTGSYLKTGPAAGADNTVNLVNADGKILTGPEWYTIFNGKTGAELITVEYKPLRGAAGVWGAVAGIADANDMGWGDDTNGNFVDRFLASIAYIDGERPSVVPCRGYYWRTACWALDWRDGKLTERWLFDTVTGGVGKDGKKYQSSQGYQSQGAHSIRQGDVDGDGFDEIVMGQSVIDHDGVGLYSTGLRHGDAFHMGAFDPVRGGLQVYMVHEQVVSNGQIGADFHNAGTGEVYWTDKGTSDVGRGCAAPITNTKGWQFWSGVGGPWDVNHKSAGSKPGSQNFAIWWGADLLREDQDGASFTGLSASGCKGNNGSKNTPGLNADLFGDWREETVLTCGSDLRVYTTTIPTTNRLYTLMHDPIYRMSVATENVAYNQPPEPGIYIGYGMTLPQDPPKIKYYGAGGSTGSSGGSTGTTGTGGSTGTTSSGGSTGATSSGGSTGTPTTGGKGGTIPGTGGTAGAVTTTGAGGASSGGSVGSGGAAKGGAIVSGGTPGNGGIIISSGGIAASSGGIVASSGGAVTTGGTTASAPSAVGGSTATSTAGGAANSGCGCRLGGADRSATLWGAMLAIGALVTARLRRRGKGSSQ
jgi:rhamnogalacturonan endolyase